MLGKLVTDAKGLPAPLCSPAHLYLVLLFKPLQLGPGARAKSMLMIALTLTLDCVHRRFLILCGSRSECGLEQGYNRLSCCSGLASVLVYGSLWTDFRA